MLTLHELQKRLLQISIKLRRTLAIGLLVGGSLVLTYLLLPLFQDPKTVLTNAPAYRSALEAIAKEHQLRLADALQRVSAVPDDVRPVTRSDVAVARNRIQSILASLPVPVVAGTVETDINILLWANGRFGSRPIPIANKLKAEGDAPTDARDEVGRLVDDAILQIGDMRRDLSLATELAEVQAANITMRESTLALIALCIIVLVMIVVDSRPSAGPPRFQWDGAETMMVGEVFSRDLAEAQAQSSRLFRMSIQMLVGGIATATVGVLVFVGTFPAAGPSYGSAGNWVAGPVTTDASHVGGIDTVQVVRSFGMLVFVEAVAWFLLRQYRVLIEDYKRFRDAYTRRINLLLAKKLLEADTISDHNAGFVAQLYKDSQPLVLDAAHRTEYAASLDHLERNLAETVIAAVRDTLSKARPDGGAKTD